MRRRRPSPALVVAVIALVFAIGGSSWAAPARRAAKQLVTGRDVRNSSLTGRDIKNRSLTGKDIKRGSLTASLFPGGLPTGPVGPRGPRGATGTVDTSRFYEKTASDARFQPRYASTIVVGADGTPAQNGQRLRDALDGLAAPADVTQAKLIKLEPGRYDVSAFAGIDNVTSPLSNGALRMKPYVDIEGSGPGVTEISADLSGATLRTVPVTGAAHTELRDLSIASTGGTTAFGYTTASGEAALRNVHISAAAANAVAVSTSAPVAIRDSTLSPTGTFALGVDTSASSTVERTRVRVTSGLVPGNAIKSTGGLVTVIDSVALATGGPARTLRVDGPGSISVMSSIIGSDGPTTTTGPPPLTGFLTCVFTAKQDLGSGSLSAANAACG